MSDFLSRLAARGSEKVDIVRPRLASIFEPVQPGVRTPPLRSGESGASGPHEEAWESTAEAEARRSMGSVGESVEIPIAEETRRAAWAESAPRRPIPDARTSFSPVGAALSALRLPTVSARRTDGDPAEANAHQIRSAAAIPATGFAATSVISSRPRPRGPEDTSGDRPKVADGIADEGRVSVRPATGVVPSDPSRALQPRPIAADAGPPPRATGPRGAARATQPAHEGEASREATIHVSIGRIDVRASTPSPAPASRRSGRTAPPIVTLDEYLRRRSGSGP